MLVVCILVGMVGHVYAKSSDSTRSKRTYRLKELVGQAKKTQPASSSEEICSKQTPQLTANEKLIEAVKAQDVDQVKAALEAGANPNWTSDTARKYSILERVLWYVGRGNLSNKEKQTRCMTILNLFFSKGAKLQPCDSNILFMPIADGFHNVVELLIKKGASPRAKIEGMTPVEWAHAYGHPLVVDALVKYGGKPISPEKAAQQRFVHLAGRSSEKNKSFEQGNIIEMEEALRNGARVNGANSKGITALAEATGTTFRLEDYITVIYLLQKGANLNLESEKRFTGLVGIPLHHAIACMSYIFNNSENLEYKVYSMLVVEALLKAGAHVSSRGENGQTPLHIAAKDNGLAAAEILIKTGAKIMDKDDNGKTPLDYAESAEMIKLLKAHGAKE